MTDAPSWHETVDPAGGAAWARAMSSPADFALEQKKLGRIWTFLGFDSDIPKTNDWFRTTLGGKSIFVQRFPGGIRAFENRCAHRFFPLKTADRGNGPVVCGYHHWRYSDDGLALGIPNCLEMYGKTPREMDARLPPVELAQCGPLIFGRFPSAGGDSLAAWLGPGADILRYLARDPSQIVRTSKLIEANWKLMFEISLDDYHIVAVHPTSFGKNGYLPPGRIRYFRFGAHSAYFPGAGADAFDQLVEECRQGTFQPQRYRIFQFFPNLIVVIVRAFDVFGDGHWYVLVQDLSPQSPSSTRSTTRTFRLPFAEQAAPVWRKLLRAALFPGTTAGVVYTMRKIQREDEVACAKLQTVARQIDGPQRVALQEARITWFEEEYARALDRPGTPARAAEFETLAG